MDGFLPPSLNTKVKVKRRRNPSIKRVIIKNELSVKGGPEMTIMARYAPDVPYIMVISGPTALSLFTKRSLYTVYAWSGFHSAETSSFKDSQNYRDLSAE
jgi:hypothetical protein